MLDFNSFLTLIQQFRNPAISDELPRVQGAAPSSERVSYYGGKWGFSFFSRRGRFIGLPDKGALEALRKCQDLAGPEALWKSLAGL